MTRQKKYTYVRFTPEEIEYIGSHSSYTKIIDLAKYFGCSSSSIRYQIAKNGFLAYRHLRQDKELAEEFIRLYNTNVPRKVLAEKYNLKVSALRQTAYIVSSKFGIDRLLHDRSGKIINKRH